MTKIIKVFDRNELKRRIGLEFTEFNSPGLLEFLAHLPYGFESSVLREIINQWFIEHKEKGDFEAAVMEALGTPVVGVAYKLPSAEQLQELALFAPTLPKRSRSSGVGKTSVPASLSQVKRSPKLPPKQKASRTSKVKD